jgi:hypothetical protein
MRLVALALLVPALASADTSATPPPPPALRMFMARVRAVAVARDARALALLVDRGFTTGEEMSRAESLAELSARPQLLDELVTILDAGRCDVETTGAQCQVHVPGTPPDRRALAIFVRERGRWRLGVFAPASDPE